MNTSGMFGTLGAELVWQVVLTGFALVAAIVPGVIALQHRSLPAPVLALGPLLAALAVLAMGRISILGWPPSDPEALRLAHTTFSAVHLLAPLTFGPVLLSSLGLLAFAGARGTPRRWAFAAVVIVLAAVVAGIVVAGGSAAANPVYGWIRGGAYVVLGLLVAAAALSGGAPAEGGPDAAAAATAAFPLAVAVGEVSERGLVYLLLGQQAGQVQADLWATGVEQMLAKVAPEWTASLAALGVASLVAATGVAAAWRGERKGAAVGAAAGCVGLAWALLLSSERPVSALAALSALAAPPP